VVAGGEGLTAAPHSGLTGSVRFSIMKSGAVPSKAPVTLPTILGGPVHRSPILCCVASVAFAAISPVAGAAQTPAGSPAAAAPASAAMGHEELMTLAKAQVEIGVAHDTADARMAQTKNKKPEVQQQIQDGLHTQIAEILHHNGLTEADYAHRIYLVSVDPGARKDFDAMVAQISGVPTPGLLPPAPPHVNVIPPADLPPGAVGMHIGHVINAFSDTPNGDGLLTVAIAEAKVAITHAGLAGRQPGNLDAMKLHAGHVLNALDPTIVTTGPGLGYGMKKAASGAATHIELAAKAPGASPNVTMHAAHVAQAARNSVARADSVIAIAKQVQAATTPADAAALVSRMASMSEQLMAGFDANGDGRVTPEEGGLQLALDHVKMMVAGEKKP
jgi:hypothetical protein